MVDYNRDIDDEKMSKINSAGIINITLENLWRDSYLSMAKGNYQTWNSKLDAVWAILGGDVKVGSDEEKTFDEISLAIYSKGNLGAKTGTGFESKANPNNAEQYQLLLKKALFLRRLQNKQGKGTAYDSDDEDDFD